MRRGDWQARQRAEQQALAALVRAAEALLLPTDEGKAAALIWAARAMVHIAESDPNERARELAESAVRRVAAEQRP